MKVKTRSMTGDASKTFEVFSIQEMLHENNLELFFLIYKYGKWEWVLAKWYEPLAQ